jgi:hypothetical protein
MPAPYKETLILFEETCRHIAHGVLAIEELGKRYDRTRAALDRAQQIMSASRELRTPPPVPAPIDQCDAPQPRS